MAVFFCSGIEVSIDTSIFVCFVPRNDVGLFLNCDIGCNNIFWQAV